MAQAGFTPISLYFSSTAAATPSAGNLVAGELALNTVDEKLYFKNSAGTVKLLASNATSAPVLTFSAGTTGFTPSTATSGAVTLAGTLATTNGGTGLTSFTSGGVVYASSTSALATGSGLVFDGSNLGIAVTPSAWSSSWKALDINTGGAGLTSSIENCYLTTNAYNNGGWKYKFTTVYGVSWYEQFNGQHAWYRASSGTAGNAISATQAMTLDASGNLLVGATSSAGRLTVQDSGNSYIVLQSSTGGYANIRCIVTSAAGIIGTEGAFPFVFRTSDSERGRFESTGTFVIKNDYQEQTYTANSSTAITLNIVTNGTDQVITLTGTATITMPTATAGKSFLLKLKTGAGAYTVTWSTVKWPSGTAPTLTSTASRMDIFSFFSDGTNWYGCTVGQNYTP
jgi:hypothetical protein